ncbi:hypothetical protein SAMN04489713_111136 [Actinomadura madurae]|uniref:Uncharacterized protein n=1 Tax=Actinomadura madurae TaxID=1993 RepID=A0A1I5M2P2_9ACTN|nr:hypothetical protein SAMN04489713_111136 [Actinomadura madurae]SPT52299.1 Uncharacterised protein [Actinomadura madurae]
MTTEEHPKTKRWILIRAAISGAIAGGVRAIVDHLLGA